MTAEPNTAPDPGHGAPDETPGAPIPGAPAPGPAPDTDTDTAEPDPLHAVRLAAADALDAVAQAITDETSTSSLLAAIEQQAQAAARAHGVTGAWNLGHVYGTAILALYASTFTTGEAENGLRARLRRVGRHEVRRHLDAATTFLRP
jgi:hypothetical protein